MTVPGFIEFPKIARLARECIVTEKIDGTNGVICITEDGDLFAGSRSQWITPAQDNYGFAKWVEGNKAELLKLGPGYHYGEWWGQGIQRNYSLREKRWSLFNVSRWSKRCNSASMLPYRACTYPRSIRRSGARPKMSQKAERGRKRRLTWLHET